MKTILPKGLIFILIFIIRIAYSQSIIRNTTETTVQHPLVKTINTIPPSPNVTAKASHSNFGKNIYVRSDVSVSGDGSIDNPYKKIQEGIDAAIFGDTIRVLEGSYNDQFTMKNGVSLIGDGVEKSKINVPIDASDSCVIKGFMITQYLKCSGVSPLITENAFIGNPEPYYASIMVSSSSSIIAKNFISECSYGIYTFRGNPMIKNNIVQAREVGISILGIAKIINNSIVAQNREAIDLGIMCQIYIIENNIFVGGIFTADQNLSSSRINYNDRWNSFDSTYQVPATNLKVDPQFVNEDLQDYHLLSSSPCINAGNPNAAYNDIDGSRNDMGAYGGPDPIRLSPQLVKSIFVSNLSGYPNDTISVFISMDNNAGLAKATFSLEYDGTLLNFIQSKLTQATQGFTLETQTISANKINLSLSSLYAMPSGKDALVEVQFVVNPNSKTNDASPLMLKDISLFDAGSKAIIIRSSTDGVFVVNFTSESENCIYVDSKYKGIGNGTRQQPFNTIMEAVNKANEGDSIIVLSGNYYESVTMKDGIDIIGSGASVTYLIVTDDQSGFNFSNIQNAQVSGFTIKADKNHSSSGALIQCGSSSPIITKNRFEAEEVIDFGISCWSNSNATIQNNYFHRMGIETAESSPIINNNVIETDDYSCFSLSSIFCRVGSAPIIKNNIIDECPGFGAICVSYATAVIQNNLIHCNLDNVAGIQLDYAHDVKVYNNIISGKYMPGAGISITNSTGSEIINNLVLSNGYGIIEYNSTSTIFNNIITANIECGVQLSSTSTCDYNDVWNNFINYNNTTTGTNDISSDPLFVDTLSRDFHLSANSPCINAGNPDIKYNDIDGTRNDMGAYGGPYVDSTWIYAHGSSLMIDSINALSVDTIQVIINGEGMQGIAEIDVTLSFDPTLLTLIDAQSSDLTRNFSLEKGKNVPGVVNLSSKSNRGISADNGKLIKLQLAVNSNKTLNTSLHFDSAAVKDEATCSRRIYKLKDGQIKIRTGVEKIKPIPQEYVLFQNYPNPFNPSTIIRYEIPKESKVTIKIYDILGREVFTLLNGKQLAGRYEVEWNAISFASGIYFYAIKAGNFFDVKKLILIK